jgi:hypothetical protein
MFGRRSGRLVGGAALAVAALLLSSLLFSQRAVLAQSGENIASCLPGWSQGAASSAERILRCVQEASGSQEAGGSATVVESEGTSVPDPVPPCQPAAPAPSSPAPEAPAPAPQAAPPAPPAAPPAPQAAPPAAPSGAAPRQQSPPPATATFQLCGGDDPETARAIERFLAGRGFSARLRGSGGCAELTLTAIPGSASLGTQSSTLSVGTSQGRVAVRIVSENGQTRVSLGE